MFPHSELRILQFTEKPIVNMDNNISGQYSWSKGTSQKEKKKIERRAKERIVSQKEKCGSARCLSATKEAKHMDVLVISIHAGWGDGYCGSELVLWGSRDVEKIWQVLRVMTSSRSSGLRCAATLERVGQCKPFLLDLDRGLSWAKSLAPAHAYSS